MHGSARTAETFAVPLLKVLVDEKIFSVGSFVCQYICYKAETFGKIFIMCTKSKPLAFPVRAVDALPGAQCKTSICDKQGQLYVKKRDFVDFVQN